MRKKAFLHGPLDMRPLLDNETQNMDHYGLKYKRDNFWDMLPGTIERYHLSPIPAQQPTEIDVI